MESVASGSSSSKRRKAKVEFGDFQTPGRLARDVCALLLRRGVQPSSILEPNCGKGSFVLACLESFPSAHTVIGADINSTYVAGLQSQLHARSFPADMRVFQGDFYGTDWSPLLQELADPLLVIGNPPWVTNAGLSAIGSSNLPEKSNFQKYAGLDAITGKSNFDISEWMLMRESEWLNGRRGTLAMLCKTAVARKVLLQAWKKSNQLVRSEIYLIDAMDYFDAAVDACLLVCDFMPGGRSTQCGVHRSLQEEACSSTFGFREGRLVADLSAYERWKFLSGPQELHQWRSGIKHDCAEVMELRKEGPACRNGLGEVVEIEPHYLYPMLKSSQLANGSPPEPARWMLVTQRFIGEDTASIRHAAPKTWEYLQRHAIRLDRRLSSIYKGRPQFSIFGVGEYSFASWKVATSAFYKKLEFRLVGPAAGKPVVFDDTCYFMACRSQEEAECLAKLLNSAPAREFYNSLVFWDAKRPLTIEILRQLDLAAVARELGLEEVLNRHRATEQPRLFATV
jgi:hypothetical protein